MKLKPYPEYKDSGVEWIGEIPEGWDAVKIKYLGEFKNGNGFSESLQGQKTGDFPFLKVSDINNPNLSIVDSSKNYVSSKIVSKNKWNLIPKNSIIFPKIGEAVNKNHRKINKKVVIIDNNLLALIVEDKFFDKYVFYIFNELNMTDFLNVSTVPSINMDLLKYYKFPITPNLNDQKSIVSFLDKKTSEIDLTIEKDTRLIELLQEKRTALINHVVTKGLDPEAPMKDSMVEWIGEIPEGWELKKLKLISKIVLGKMLTPSDKGSYHLKPYLRAQNILWEKVSTDEIKEMWFSKNELKTYRLQKYDLLVSEGGEVGRTAIWKDELDECYIQNSVHKVSLNPGNNPKYFLYAFQACGNSDFFSAIVNRVSIAHLTREKLKEISFPVPNKLEQEKIVNFLDSNIKKIDQIISKIQENIQLLEEYKKSLIHHVVTGKVYVIKED
jgi:type I restriction enzyme S subunit